MNKRNIDRKGIKYALKTLPFKQAISDRRNLVNNVYSCASEIKAVHYRCNSESRNKYTKCMQDIFR